MIFVLLGHTSSPAFAGTAEEINALPTLDSLNRTENPLSNGGKWSALAWATNTSGHATGQDTTTGWAPYDAFLYGSNGAYWNPATFSDANGSAAAITMQTAPGIEQRYVSLWLDMSSPGSTKSGYQLRWTVNPSISTYTVTLSKWSSGSQTVLASNASVSIATGTTMAISDTGPTVTAWQGTGGSLTSIMSASDSTFSSGYAGIEGAGNISRSTNFKAGSLSGGGGAPPDTAISSGPKGVVVPNLSFGFTSTEAGSSFECTLDGAGFSACTSPKAYQGLAEGPHTFQVRATGAGGKDQTPAQRGFQVVQTAKATTKTALLDNFERSEVPLATGKWSKSSWAAEIGGAWMGSYRGYGSNSGLAGAYWNPTTFNHGEGTVLVSAVVGTGSTPAGQYMALWLNMPSPSSARSGYEARFTGVNGSASNYTVELSKWVSGTRSVLASSSGFSLPVGTIMALSETAGGSIVLWAGTSTMSPALTATDSTYTSGYAGLEVNGGAGTAYNFRAGQIDLQAPDTVIQTGPSGTVLPGNVSFSFTATEAGSSFECSIDSGTYSTCTSPKTYPGLASGSHTFRVRAVDAASNQDGSPAERTFTVAQAPTVSTGSASTAKGEATLRATVNPQGVSTTYQFEYGATTAYGSKIPTTAKAVGSGTAVVEVSEVLSGLPNGTTYHYRISATNAAGSKQGEDRTFTTPGSPIVTTEEATAVNATEATLLGTVNPQNASTTYQFEYGPTTAYGTKAPASPMAVGSGSSVVAGSTAISGLAQNATYHFRIVASNSVGTIYSQDRTFTTLTLPVAETETAETAEPVEANTAVLEGTVDPNGSETSYRFQYGPTTAYGQESAVGYEELDAPNEDSEIVEPLVYLKPETTYHYRLVAKSAAGTDYGEDKTVTTGPAQMTAAQEAIQEEEDVNYTARLTPAPGLDFAGLHQHGDKNVQMRDAPMNAVAHSGAKWLRVQIHNGVEKFEGGELKGGTLEDIFAKAANRGVRILPYMETEKPPANKTLEEEAEDYLVAAIAKYGPNGTFWSKDTTASGVPITVKNLRSNVWEIGNEPNRGENDQVRPAAFGDFFAKMSGAAKATANVQVLLAGLYSANETSNAYPGCKPSCVMTVTHFIKAMDHVNSYDALSLHPYHFKVDGAAPTSSNKGRVIKRIYEKLVEAREALQSTGQASKPIWITEFGFPTAYSQYRVSDADLPAIKKEEEEVPPVNETVQRELIEAAFNVFKSRRTELNIAHAFYFNLQDYTLAERPIPHWPYGTGLRKRSGKHKQGWEGFAREANGHAWWPRAPQPKKPLARSVRPRAADVAAAVDTDGTDAAYYFRYRKKNTSEWTNSAGGGTQAIEGDQDVEGTLTGLSPETEYEYQVVVTNENEATEVSPVQGLETGPMKETTATVTDELNGEPGWASVAGWSKYDGVGLHGFKVRVNFLKSDGTYVYQDVYLVNGQYSLDNMPLGKGSWQTWSVFLAQGGYPESSSGYHPITIKSGYRLVAKHSEKCLDVYQGHIGEGASLIQYQCDPQLSLNQVFTMVPMDNQHRYQLVARHSNRCVGVTAGSQSAGQQLSQTNCLGPAWTHQIWKSEEVLPNGPDNSYNRFIAQHSGQCMEVRESSGANGGIVEQYPCAGAQANQLWTFQSVEANQVPTQTFWSLDEHDTYHGMPGYISFHGRIDIGERAYPLAGRKVHVFFDRPNAQGQYDGVPDKEHVADTNAAGEYSFKYLGIARDTWRVWAVFYGTGDALGKSESATHPVTIKSGYRLMFRSSQKCLTTSGNGTANGTWLIQWTCNPNWDPWDGQVFSLYPVDPVGSNHWQLRPNTANNPPYGQCVDVYGASTANGAPLNLYQCIPGAANQVWSFPELGSPNNGWFGGVAMHSNKCMDVTAGNPNNGVQIEQYECVWNGNQQFAWLVVP